MKKLKNFIKENILLFFIFQLLFVPYRMIVKYSLLIPDVFYGLVYFNSLTLPIRNHLTIGVRKLGLAKVFLPHPIGLVIGKKVALGKNCTIYQNVTIGAKNFLAESYPQIGNNVTIYANAILIGDIVIGDNCIIGAATLVNKSIPANCTVVGNPMKIIQNIKIT